MVRLKHMNRRIVIDTVHLAIYELSRCVINESLILDIYQKIEMTDEVSTNNRTLYVGNNKRPDALFEVQINLKSFSAVCFDYCTIGSV